MGRRNLFAFRAPEAPKAKEAAEFTAYSVGICAASVCTSLTDPKEIAARMNALHPTGISSDWTISEDKKFLSGDPMPCACSDHPATHKHWLLVC